MLNNGTERNISLTLRVWGLQNIELFPLRDEFRWWKYGPHGPLVGYLQDDTDTIPVSTTGGRWARKTMWLSESNYTSNEWQQLKIIDDPTHLIEKYPIMSIFQKATVEPIFTSPLNSEQFLTNSKNHLKIWIFISFLNWNF